MMKSCDKYPDEEQPEHLVSRKGGKQTINWTRAERLTGIALFRESKNDSTLWMAITKIMTDVRIKSGHEPVDMTTADWKKVEKLLSEQEKNILKTVREYYETLYKHLNEEYSLLFNK